MVERIAGRPNENEVKKNIAKNAAGALLLLGVFGLPIVGAADAAYTFLKKNNVTQELHEIEQDIASNHRLQRADSIIEKFFAGRAKNSPSPSFQQVQAAIALKEKQPNLLKTRRDLRLEIEGLKSRLSYDFYPSLFVGAGLFVGGLSLSISSALRRRLNLED